MVDLEPYTTTTKDIFVCLDVDGAGVPFITSTQPAVDTLAVGHAELRFVPVWNEHGLERFITHPGQVGWMPYVKVMAVSYSAPNGVSALFDEPAEPPATSYDLHRLPQSGSQLVHRLDPDCTFSAPGPVSVDYTLTINYRNAVLKTTETLTWTGTLQVDPRPDSGIGAPGVTPSRGRIHGNALVLPVVVEYQDDQHPSVVWNAGTETESVNLDGVSRVRWLPLRHEADFLAYWQGHGERSPNTRFSGVGFAMQTDAEQVFDFSRAETTTSDGSYTLPVKSTADPRNELDYSYTVYTEEGDLGVQSSWDPTLKILPRGPGQPG